LLKCSLDSQDNNQLKISESHEPFPKNIEKNFIGCRS
jgi:hypothetical protein